MATAHSEAARVVGERVRRARLSLELSQEDIADLAEMHVTNLGKIERGQANPSLTTLIRIAAVLGVDPGDLVREIGGDQLPPRAHQLTAAQLIRERTRREA